MGIRLKNHTDVMIVSQPLLCKGLAICAGASQMSPDGR